MYLSFRRIIWQNVVLYLILCLAPISSYSQWVDPENGIVVEPTVSVNKFMRYGNTPVSLYTGNIDLSVPIYTYQDYEFDVPISLKYVYGGQKPNDPSGSFGQGWILNAGGYITRQIKNLPDEAQMRGNDNVYGFYEMHRNGWSVPDIYTSSYPFWNTSVYYYPMGSKNVEAEPDIFSFNFMGHSGKFMFWGNNRIVVYETSSPKGNYTVEVTVAYERITGITIKTKDGYTYKFDGSKNLDTANEIISYDYKIDSWLNKSNGPQVMWPLVSVSAPSGRTLSLEYDMPDEYVDSAQPISYIIDNDKINPENPLRELQWVHFACLSEQKQKGLYLKKISLSDIFSVDFNYSAARNKESYFDRSRALTKMNTARLLSSIVVNDLSDNTTLKTATMYYNEGKPNPVPFLKRVKISDEGSYDFQYWNEWDENITPYKGTFGIDHWGYRNGKDQNRCDDYFPRTTLNNNEETITSASRDPDFKYTLSGALQSVVYPTRGKTEFVYEPHDYSAAVIKSGKDFGKPYLEFLNQKKIAGGIRIKQIIDYDYEPRGDVWRDTLRIRKYSYTDVHGRSSGVLLRSPRYRTSHILATEVPGSQSVMQKFIATSDLLECIDTDHHMEYCSATETYRDSSYCIYQYLSYQSRQDKPVEDYLQPITDWAPGGIVVNDPYKYFYMRPGSKKATRGKLFSKCIYRAKNNPDDPDIYSYSENYDYNSILDGVWNIRLTRYYWYRQDIITETSRLFMCTKRYRYDDEGALSTYAIYQYDINTDYVTEVKYHDKTGKYIKDTIIYGTGDYLTDSPFPVKIHTRVMIPEEKVYKTSEIKTYDYVGMRVTPSFIVPRLTHVWKTQLEQPKVYNSETEHQQDLILEKTLVPSASRFNQETDRAGNMTSYIYGPSGCNLLAVIRNVSYNDALSAIGNYLDLDNYSLTDAQETALRNIPGALVTTYSYLPLTGLSSVTDPSGYKQEYTYDDRRRLSGVYSHGHKEKTYKYQIFDNR